MNKKMNNELDCAIVGDLLSLYHDDVVSETTKTAVEEHLAGCERCRGEYDSMCMELPVEAGRKSTGKRFSSLMKRQKTGRILSIVLPILLACAILVTGYYVQLSTPFADFNNNVELAQVYRFESNGVSKFFFLVDHPMYDGAVSCELTPVYGEKGVSLVLSFEKPIIATRLEGRCTYAEIYESPSAPGTFTCDEVYEVRVGDTVVWSEDKNADDAIPAYVYEYELFDGEHITTWDIDYDKENPSACTMSALYGDGRTVVWDFEGNVIDEYIDQELDEIDQ